MSALSLYINKHLFYNSGSSQLLSLFLGTKKKENSSWEYLSTVEEIKKRLDIMGYSIENAEKKFQDGIEHFVKKEKNSLSDSEIENCRKLTLDLWIQSIKEIFDQNIDRHNLEEKIKTSDADLQFSISFLLDQPDFECIAGMQSFNEVTEEMEKVQASSILMTLRGYLWGFAIEETPPSYEENQRSDFDYNHPFFVLRLALEHLNKDYEILLDCNYFIENEIGFHDAEFLNDQDLFERYTKFEKIIVLCEGTTDGWLIEKTLQTHYPYLCPYYYFMDFNKFNVQGGASSLVSFAKAFAGAGIRNRILVIVDNDAAGTQAEQALLSLKLPSNFHILKLPHLSMAENYPAHNVPDGNIVNCNINGLACSIELYLGRDILTDQNGQLIPIQWNAFNPKTKSYQGEITNKAQIQEKYSELMDKLERNSQPSDHDWEPMELLLKSMSRAFMNSYNL